MEVAQVKPLRLKAQRSPKIVAITKVDPIAEICVDTGVFHLPDIFDYLVPLELEDVIQPGVLVKVPFGSEVKMGYVTSRKAISDTSGKLKSISKVLTPLALLTPDLITLVSAVCERYACKPWDLIKSAIPSRSLAAETRYLTEKRPDAQGDLITQNQEPNKLRSRKLTIIVEQDGLVERIDELLSKNSLDLQLLVIVPDERDLIQLSSHIFIVEPIILTSTGEKSDRYESFLRSRFERPRLIIGTRSAIFTPLAHGSTVLLYNDGDESMYERRHPGWNTRDVALLRSSQMNLEFVSQSPSLEVVRLSEVGWLSLNERAKNKAINRSKYHFSDGRISEIGTIKTGLKLGNVLVVMAETGYVSAIACQNCRNQSKCECGGKLYLPTKASAPHCAICDKSFDQWECKWCSGKIIRAIARGSSRYVEELGKAVPGTKVLLSKGGSRIDMLPESSQAQMVVASYGCEPKGEYAAVVMLSLGNLTNRVDLRSLESARRSIFENINRIGDIAGCAIYLDLPSDHPISQGILRGDSYSLAKTELEERNSSKLAPNYRIAIVEGPSSDIQGVARAIEGNILFSQVSVVDRTTSTKYQTSDSKLILRCEISNTLEFSQFIEGFVRYRSLKGLKALSIRMDPYSI